MREETTKTEQPCESKTFTRRIGSTTYRVSVHFNPESQETVKDKIVRLIRNEVQNEKVVRP